MASKNKDERALVNLLIKSIVANSPCQVYTHVDRDSGSERHTSSGWDFLLARGGLVVFCEAKMEKGKLSDWQNYVAAAVSASGGHYLVVRFYEKLFFTINGEKPLEILKAKIDDFI